MPGPSLTVDLAVQAVSYVSVATHRDSYLTTRKECKRLQQEGLNSNVGLDHRL